MVFEGLSMELRAIAEQLVPIFPQLTAGVIQASVTHPSNYALDPSVLLERCIDDLLSLRTFCEEQNKSSDNYSSLEIVSDGDPSTSGVLQGSTQIEGEVILIGSQSDSSQESTSSSSHGNSKCPVPVNINNNSMDKNEALIPDKIHSRWDKLEQDRKFLEEQLEKIRESQRESWSENSKDRRDEMTNSRKGDAEWNASASTSSGQGSPANVFLATSTPAQKSRDAYSPMKRLKLPSSSYSPGNNSLMSTPALSSNQKEEEKTVPDLEDLDSIVWSDEESLPDLNPPPMVDVSDDPLYGLDGLFSSVHDEPLPRSSGFGMDSVDETSQASGLHAAPISQSAVVATTASTTLSSSRQTSVNGISSTVTSAPVPGPSSSIVSAALPAGLNNYLVSSIQKQKTHMTQLLQNLQKLENKPGKRTHNQVHFQPEPDGPLSTPVSTSVPPVALTALLAKPATATPSTPAPGTLANPATATLAPGLLASSLIATPGRPAPGSLAKPATATMATPVTTTPGWQAGSVTQVSPQANPAAAPLPLPLGTPVHLPAAPPFRPLAAPETNPIVHATRPLVADAAQARPPAAHAAKPPTVDLPAAPPFRPLTAPETNPVVHATRPPAAHAATQAQPSVAHGTRPPAAHAARPPVAHAARPPAAHAARPPAAHAVRPPAATQAQPHVARPPAPPAATQAQPPVVHAARPPAPPAAKPPAPLAATQAQPPVAHAAKPPVAQAARPPVAHAARPPVAQAARPPAPPAVAQAQPPLVHAARPPVAHAARPPVAHAARPPAPPAVAQAQPPLVHAARPPVAHAARPPVAHAARPPAPPAVAQAQPPVVHAARPPVAHAARPPAPPAVTQAQPPVMHAARPPYMIQDGPPVGPHMIDLDHHVAPPLPAGQGFPQDPLMIDDDGHENDGHANNELLTEMVNNVLMLLSDAEPGYVRTQCERFLHQPNALDIVCNWMFENEYPKVKKEVPPPKETTPVKPAAVEADLYTEYSGHVSSIYRSECFNLLKNDFILVSVKDLRAVSSFFDYHYAPIHKSFIDAMKKANVTISQGKIVNPTEKVATIQVEGQRTTTIMGSARQAVLARRVKLLRCGRRRMKVPIHDANLQAAYDFVSKKETMEKQAMDEQLAAQLNVNEYEESGQMIDCGCCYCECPFENMVQCYEGHLFCADCLKRYAQESVFGQGKADLKCMEAECDATFPKSQLSKALPANVYEKYEDRCQEEALNLAGLEGLVRCPHCDFAAILDPGDKVFQCQNPACMKETCRNCKEDWEEHFGIPCSEMEKKDETKIRTTYEEKMSEAKIRTCHRCKTGFMKLDGCNKMTCRCGAKMCYICRKPNIDYNHFCRHLREPGKNCTMCTACSLWTNPEQDDERAVAEIRKQGHEERAKQGFTESREIGAPDGPTPAKRPRLV